MRRLFDAVARRTPLRWHLPNFITRMELIQRSCDTLRAQRYLEIGVANGSCFESIRVPEKIGVDPIAPQPKVTAILSQPGVSYYSLTSDAFFANEAPRALQDGVDVVFIDGLHTYEQAYLDCVNAVRHLKPGGIILVHDNLPKSAAEGVRAHSWEEAVRLNSAGWSGNWTGDGWKAIVRLRSFHRELSACVFDCDFGVAAVWQAPSPRMISSSLEEIEAMTFDDLARDPRRLLGLQPPAALNAILDTCLAMRAATAIS